MPLSIVLNPITLEFMRKLGVYFPDSFVDVEEEDSSIVEEVSASVEVSDNSSYVGAAAVAIGTAAAVAGAVASSAAITGTISAVGAAAGTVAGGVIGSFIGIASGGTAISGIIPLATAGGAFGATLGPVAAVFGIGTAPVWAVPLAVVGCVLVVGGLFKWFFS